MNVAIVAPSPVPFAVGGVEGLLAGLRDAIPALTPHQVEVIKLPAGEATFWDLVESYRRFAALDLRHFDLVISTKYPAWMVQHPRHVCYLQHRSRALYDVYPESLGTALPDALPEVRRLTAFMARHDRGSAAVLGDFFALLDRLRDAAPGLPPDVFRRPGPLIRRVVHFLDDLALSPRRIRRFLAISRVVAARARYFPEGVSIDVLPHPSGLGRFTDVAAEHLFTSSRLDTLKRLDVLIAAMRRARTSLPLLIAGTGPEEAVLRELAGSDDRIRLLGFVPDAELTELYGRALAVPFVPYDEDYGLVTIEAMMSGKPVLTCTDSGGPLEFVTDGNTGLVVPPTPEALARGIERLAGDVKEARQMGRRGRDRVRDITWERTVATLLAERVAGHARPATTRRRAARRPRVTVAVPFEVFPPSGGGQHRIFSLYRHVAAIFDVDLVTLGPPGAPPLEADIAPGLREIRVPKTSAYADEEGRLRRAAGGVPIGDVAPARLLHLVPAYADFLARSLAGAAIVVASHPYAIGAIRACAVDVPLVYEAHNVEAGLKEETFGASVLTSAAREAEAEACRCAGLVFACGAEDREELCRRYALDPGRVRLAPNGVDTDAIPFTARRERLRRRAELDLGATPIAVFVGSWHPPNVEAAEAILDLARTLSHVTFLLAGNHTLRLAGVRPTNVALMGLVDDDTLATLLALADVALNPMRSGSGTNLKIATYLAAGLPVVTTPFGARGYGLVDGEQAVVVPLDEFVEGIARVLADQALAERLAAAGRRLAEERYDWKAIAAGVVADLESLITTERVDRVSAKASATRPGWGPR